MVLEPNVDFFLSEQCLCICNGVTGLGGSPVPVESWGTPHNIWGVKEDTL